MIALVDCNNFYASCERVFNPSLNDKPIIVLSNNDGCVIARSNEAKKIGISMGVPAFKIKSIISKYNIQVSSTNFSLYGDMSHRVIDTIMNTITGIEIYSIDEVFIDLNDFKKKDLISFGRMLRKKIKKINSKLYLQPNNALYKPIQITSNMDFIIWGIVTYVIHKPQ